MIAVFSPLRSTILVDFTVDVLPVSTNTCTAPSFHPRVSLIYKLAKLPNHGKPITELRDGELRDGYPPRMAQNLCFPCQQGGKQYLDLTTHVVLSERRRELDLFLR